MGENLSTCAEASAALRPEMSVAEALELLRRSPDAALPVMSAGTGEVLGVLSRPDQTPPAPPRLGGMATPLGVYLTDGRHGGGAGFWGLFLTGVTMGTLTLAAQAILQGVTLALGRAGLRMFSLVPSGLSAPLHWWLTQLAVGLGPTLLLIALLFLLLRGLPMSGTHAAEHQVVHCVERGAPLVPSCVRMMPRVHPRCGTNLVVGFALFQFSFLAVWSAAQSVGWSPLDAASLSILIAAPAALTFWRRLGGWVQLWLATRPATDRQIDSAIRAAQQLLRRRAEEVEGRSRFQFARRLWRMGLAQVLCGYAALTGLLTITAHFWPRLGTILGL